MRKTRIIVTVDKNDEITPFCHQLQRRRFLCWRTTAKLYCGYQEIKDDDMKSLLKIESDNKNQTSVKYLTL